jgi:hypothetical protein
MHRQTGVTMSHEGLLGSSLRHLELE